MVLTVVSDITVLAADKNSDKKKVDIIQTTVTFHLMSLLTLN